jgi:hypothetical protein
MPTALIIAGDVACTHLLASHTASALNAGMGAPAARAAAHLLVGTAVTLVHAINGGDETVVAAAGARAAHFLFAAVLAAH